MFKYIRNISLLLFLLGATANAQSNRKIFEDEKALAIAKEAVDHIYNYDFKEGDVLINKLKASYSDHPAYTLLKCLSIYQQSVFNIDKDKSDPKYLQLLKKAIDQANYMYHKNEHDDEGIFFELLAHSYLALYHNENKSYLSAASEGKRTYKYLKKGYDRKESNAEFYLSSGLLDYYIEQFPESVPASKAVLWMFPDGDKERGISYFVEGSNKATFTSPECLSYLMHVYLKYESDYPKALVYGKEAVAKFPDNLFFRARYIEALLGVKQYKEAKKEIDLLLKSEIDFFKFVGYTLNGIYYENYKGNYEIAKNNFIRAKKIGERNVKVCFDYLSMAYNGLGRFYDRNKDFKSAEYYFDQSQDIAEYISIKEEAERFLDKY